MESHRHTSTGPRDSSGRSETALGSPQQGRESSAGTETQLRHGLLTGQAGYKQPKPFHPKFVTDVSQISVSEPGVTTPAYTATPAPSNSPLLLPHHCCSTFYLACRKRKGKKQQQDYLLFGLQTLLCKAELHFEGSTWPTPDAVGPGDPCRLPSLGGVKQRGCSVTQQFTPKGAGAPLGHHSNAPTP